MTTYLIGGAGIALLAGVVLMRLVWRVAEPNEALVISGLGARGHNGADADSLGFKIVVGRGTAIIPGFQTVRRLDLDLKSAKPQVECVDSQGIKVHVTCVVAYKVGDDLASIANAARRFLGQPDQVMEGAMFELFSGHLRAIVGGMTVETMLHDRQQLTDQVRSSLAHDMAKLGLIVDSLQIQEIQDGNGYIDNLGKPQAAVVAAKARIAQAERDKEATEAEERAAAEKAAAIRASKIKQAHYQAEVDEATAKAGQAFPLSEAVAKQEVVVAETRAAELAADLAEKRLQSEVLRPADARAYEQRTLAQAGRDAQIARAEAAARETTLQGQAEAEATKAKGDAEASAIKAKGEAEAAGIEARARALAQNQDAVIAQQLAGDYAAIVAGAAKAFENVGTMVVLNGADGIEDMLGKVLTMGGAGFGVAQRLVTSLKTEAGPGNGRVPGDNILADLDGHAAG